LSALKPRNKLLLALPLVATVVVFLAYFRLFTNPAVIVFVLVLYVGVSLWNRRKFSRASKREN
jgi:positive regulator of sigma E activity